MLENLSVTWGGAGHLVVPVDDQGEIHPEIWKLAKLYDADRWAAYANTYRGYQMADEKRFSDWLEQEARKWARKHGGGIARAREMLTAEHIMRDPVGGWPPPEELKTRIKRETGAAGEEDRVVFAMHTADAGPGHHLVDVADLQPLPERVRILSAHHLPTSLQILVALRTGALAPRHIRRLLERGVTLESVAIADDDLAFVLRLAWLGPDRQNRWSFRQSISERLGGPQRSAPPYVDADFLDSTPIALSRLGCAQLSRWYAGRDTQPFTVVVGSHVDDFSYAMCLQRCGVPALWLPKEFVSGRNRLSKTVRETLSECLVDGSGRAVEDPHQLCSTSLDRPMLERLSDRLTGTTTWGSRLHLEVVDGAQLPPHRIPALMDQDRYDDPLDVPFDGEAMASGCPVTVPSSVRADDPWKLTWWVELDAPDHQLPGRTALNHLTIAESTGWRSTARSGRDGVSFFSHTMGLTLSGSPVEHHLDRPRVRLPSADAVFSALGDSVGLALHESSAGRFRRLSEDLWGGLSNFADDLRSPTRRALLDAWLSKDPSGASPGVFTTSSRRFLNLEDAATASGMTRDEIRPVIDEYLNQGILRRGLALKCRQCQLFEWYELDEVGQFFRCRRCREETTVTRAAWKGDFDEPAFYYDLVEVVYQALRGNVHVPVAALDSMRREAHSFLHVPEIETTSDDGDRLELDIAAIVDGRIVLGEAKSTDKLAGTKQKELAWLKKLARVCELLTADEVVFATSKPAWRDVTRQRIESTFEPLDCEMRLLQGV